jgi:hypothetical protein
MARLRCLAGLFHGHAAPPLVDYGSDETVALTMYLME